jgi:uncharacterized protein YkwD
LALKVSRSKVDTRRVTRPLAVATAAVALVAGGTASGLASAAASPHGPRVVLRAGAITEVPALETDVLAAINALRRSRGLAPLRASAPLATAAREHSMSMAERGVFEHSSPNGSPFWQRLAAGYGRHGDRLWRVGENMAWAAPGLHARSVLELWLTSPAHRENLFAPAWREIGLGAVHARAAPGVYQGFDVTILTVDFGVRR